MSRFYSLTIPNMPGKIISFTQVFGNYQSQNKRKKAGFKLWNSCEFVIKSFEMQTSSMHQSCSIFQQITPAQAESIREDSLYLQTMFWVEGESHQVSTVLTSTCIAVSNCNNTQLCAIIEFDLKFQTLYSQPGNVRSPKIGFRLIRKGCPQVEFKTDSEAMANTWVKFLSKKLNQLGFHQLYKPVRKVGKGGFATVYEVERLSDGAHLAVKAFSKQNTLHSANPSHRASLLNEIKMLRTFDSPSVLQADAVFESDNSLYIIQELLTAGQMHTLVNKRQGKFTAAETKKLMRGILHGLADINGRRVMHRDIKPQNIMLRTPLEPVIADFGLSAHCDSQDYLFYRCGTPGYVAPEITTLAQGQHVEPTCDVFSAGAVFHVLLTGKPLFSGQKFDQVYQNNRKMRFDLSKPHYQGVDRDAMNLLASMLHSDPECRITAQEALGHSYLREAGLLSEKAESPTLTTASVKLM